MYKVRFNNRILEVPDGAVLSDILIKSGENIPHICGGKGTCKKCLVLVDGKEELSCQYQIKSDIDVVLPENNDIFSESCAIENGKLTENTCFCLDIGTTTLALALVSLDEKRIIKAKTTSNPQRAFGGDVLSRIEFCKNNGFSKIQSVLIEKINEMLNSFGVNSSNTMYVSGNTTMLHIFFGIDPSSIGVAPYTPVFLESKTIKSNEIGIKNIKNIVSLPCISSFIGADLVAGINYTDLPEDNKYNILIDLGTNAEIIVYNKNKIYCTSAAAGPCFEGANITCGMSSSDGAIYAYSDDYKFETINNQPAKGICGTGLIDIIAVLLRKGIIDVTGYINSEEFFITDSIKLTQKDIRQFQLAKSAIYSAIEVILKDKSIFFTDIKNTFISGGFSAKINIDNAIKTGLLPKELKDKIIVLNNSSLLGTIKYACEQNDLSVYLKNAEYIDLSVNEYFSELFIENLEF